MARRAWGIAAVLTLVSVAACGSGKGAAHPAAAPSGPAPIGASRTLTGNEALYGASPTQNGPIVYQPDVVFVGGGADSVRSVSSDGLIWTIDGHAANADRLQPGAVMFVSSFGAGRVLAVDDVNGDKRVALGPVALTDIIQDGSFGTDTPIPVTNVMAYSTPDQPGLETELSDDTGTTPTSDPASSSSGLRSISAALPRDLPPLPPPAPAVPDSTIGAWNVNSFCCTSIGLHLKYDKGGARIEGTASLQLDAPSVTFDLVISGGSVKSAGVRLHGAGSLKFSIAAAVEASSADFHGGRIQVPVDLAIPIPIGNLPVTVGLQQIFSVSLGLSGKAELSTSGEYSLGGTLGFSLIGGSANADVPSVTTTKSALDSITSIAVAPQALTFSYAVKLSVGIGPPGLSAGIWYQVAASLGIATSGTDVKPIGTSLVACKTVSLAVLGRYGVGYQIPSIVAKAINFFMKLLFKNPPKPLQPTGGPSWGPSTLFSKSTPPCSK